MKCAIMQPTFLPWAGYFNLMASVDVFVFLDDAQYQKSSWHNRNRVPVNDVPQWLTVPIQHQALSQSILDTVVNPQPVWRQKMLRQLTQLYARHPYRSELECFTALIADTAFTSLAELNIALITMVAGKLRLSCNMCRSSTMNSTGVRTERVLAILKEVGATAYLSPQGARDYLTEDGFCLQNEFTLSYQEFTAKAYPQMKSSQFIEKLSIVDVVMNIGWDATAQYVKNAGE